MTATKLAGSLGRELDRRDAVELWRAGVVFRWSPAFGQFVETVERVSIRPMDSLAALEREHDGIIAIYDF